MTMFYWFLAHFVVGLWLIFSPYALGFTEAAGAYWNALIAGLLYVVSSGFGMYYGREEAATAQTHRKVA